MQTPWDENNPPGYVGRDCKNCGRNRVEIDGRCEKCGHVQSCDHCDNQATCIGDYEGHEDLFACDDCCGHGCEDGFCNQLLPVDDHVR
jgi:hypothetical protein